MTFEEAVWEAISYWLTCPESEIRAAWIPSQAEMVLKVRAEWWALQEIAA